MDSSASSIVTSRSPRHGGRASAGDGFPQCVFIAQPKVTDLFTVPGLRGVKDGIRNDICYFVSESSQAFAPIGEKTIHLSRVRICAADAGCASERPAKATGGTASDLVGPEVCAEETGSAYGSRTDHASQNLRRECARVRGTS
ncbi:hypothetical protein MRX96_024164 [Rhipicephalus microplus]